MDSRMRLTSGPLTWRQVFLAMAGSTALRLVIAGGVMWLIGS